MFPLVSPIGFIDQKLMTRISISLFEPFSTFTIKIRIPLLMAHPRLGYLMDALE
jgi:hypothetical protein